MATLESYASLIKDLFKIGETHADLDFIVIVRDIQRNCSSRSGVTIKID